MRSRFIESHDDVCTQRLLDFYGTLWGNEVGRSVKMGLEGNTLFRNFGKLLETENLITPAVGEDGVVPVHKFVQTTQRTDQVVPWPEIEMIGIAKDNLRPRRFQVFRRQCLYSCLGSHRHEAGGFYPPAGCGQNPQTGGRVAMCFDNFEMDHVLI